MKRSAAHTSDAARKATAKKAPPPQQEKKYLWALFDSDGDFNYDVIPFEPMTEKDARDHVSDLNPDYSPYKLYRMELAGTLSVNGVTFTPAEKLHGK